MRTNLKKTGLPALAAAAAIVLCSFTYTTKESEKIKTSVATESEDWSEWHKVQEFVSAKVVTVISESRSKGHATNFNSFSRCPSGYESTLAGKKPEVTCEKIVYGKVHLFRGCSPKYVCDFKVCVNKELALVKSGDMTDYVTVAEWLKKNDAPAVVQQSKKIKG